MRAELGNTTGVFLENRVFVAATPYAQIAYFPPQKILHGVAQRGETTEPFRPVGAGGNVDAALNPGADAPGFILSPLRGF
jgi:hypothetical protein